MIVEVGCMLNGNDKRRMVCGVIEIGQAASNYRPTRSLEWWWRGETHIVLASTMMDAGF